MNRKSTGILLAGIVFFAIVPAVFCAGRAESASSATRGRYLAGQGIIVPPEEVYTDSYIASIDYRYPQPEGDLGVYLYNSSGQMSRRGQEGILQIGLQGKKLSFASLPPMNLVFVVDSSDSMNEEDKIAWVRESMAVFMNKIRDADSLALVSFNDSAQVLFESTRMDSPEKKRRFLEAVNGIRPSGGTDLEAGLKAGYEQALANYRSGSVNRVFFFSDGTEFSSRLAQAGAQSGDIRVSLLWNNRNDLDIHVVTPRGEEVFYGHTRDASGGFLDVDMNVHGETIKPIENIFWAQGRAPQGKYRISVQNYAYHEARREAVPFQVELKNGNEYTYFEGSVSGAGKGSDTEVCVFEYKGASALKEEKALIYQMAESYRQMGISVSTLGVGVGFDLELMRNLAEEGGGSSRFISDREEMRKTFDTEFERMAVLLDQDLSMELEFMPGVEILETWGYQHRIEGNRVFYTLPALHLGDYETMLVRYRLLPDPGPGDERPLALFTVRGRDALGQAIDPAEKTVNIVLAQDPVDGISSGMVLYSGTMMRFAETLKEIGNLYYAGQDDLNALSQFERAAGRAADGGRSADGAAEELKRAFLARLDGALQKTRAFRDEMANAKLRLDDGEAFTKELEILDRYDEILAREIRDNGGNPAGGISAAPVPAVPAAIPSGPGPSVPPDFDKIQPRVTGLFREIGLSFPEGEVSVAALASFAIRDGGDPPLIAYLNESALVALSGNPRLTLVERSRLDAVRAEQQLAALGMLDTDAAIRVGKLLGARYMVTGQVIPMSAQVIVFSRVINVETAEIISAAQVFLDRAALGELL
ncbi:MAG: VWA domain-containing protein [Treponema sp.]|jgi:Ca-activated chloride channel family protein|nr:VWA domain-containing protein [Treponema sp.]